MPSRYVGIDLGTTYSNLAFSDDAGNVTIEKNYEMEDTTPSVVYVDSDGKNVLVGTSAKDYLADYGKERSISNIKEKMGTDYTVSIDGKAYTPVEISSFILRKLIGDYNRNHEDDLKEAVITIPTTFGQNAIDATIEAGRVAGLKNIFVLHEPIAAAISFGITNKSSDGKRILVFDLGGGTFDICAIDITGNEYSIIAKGGKAVGGKDWDNVIMNIVLRNVSEKTGVPVETLKTDGEMMSKLEVDSERVKTRLSTSDNNRVTARYNNQRFAITVTRDEFERESAFLVKEVMETLRDTMAARNLTAADIDTFVMVGGSSKMPMIKRAMETEFPDSEIKLFEPNLSIARGAAIYSRTAAISSANVVDRSVESKTEEAVESTPEPVMVPPGDIISIKNILSKSYGIKAKSKDRSSEFVSNIIFRDSPIPLEKTRRYAPASENQSAIRITIYENDARPNIEGQHNPIESSVNVGEFVIDLPKEAFGKKAEVSVTFQVSDEGILTAVTECLGVKEYRTLERKIQMNDEQFKEAQKLMDKLTH